MQVISLWTSASDLPYLLPWWPPPKGAEHDGSTSPTSRWCQWWTSPSDLPYLLPWWPPPKGAERDVRASPTSRLCQLWTSASNLPYLLPWWPPPKGMEHGSRTSPTCSWCHYELLLVIYLICCLGDLLPGSGAWRQNLSNMQVMSISNSANYPPYLLPSWHSSMGAKRGGRTSPTCRWCHYELLLVVYLICCLGDLLPRERSVAAVPLQQQVISLWTSASDLAYLLTWWPPKGSRAWRKNLSNMQVMSISNSANYPPYLLPSWHSSMGAKRGGRTSPTCRWCHYELLLVVYLICCLGDLLPRERSVGAVPLQQQVISLWTSARDLPYLLPWWPPLKGADVATEPL